MRLSCLGRAFHGDIEDIWFCLRPAASEVSFDPSKLIRWSSDSMQDPPPIGLTWSFPLPREMEIEQGRIHGSTVAGGWAGAVMSWARQK